MQGYFKAVGIDAELVPTTSPAWMLIALVGGTWEGMLQGGVTGNAYVAEALTPRYIGGGRYFTQRMVPEDYVKAVKNAIAAPDFITKQKWTQTAMKLSIDKYSMRTVFRSRPEFGAGEKKSTIMDSSERQTEHGGHLKMPGYKSRTKIE